MRRRELLQSGATALALAGARKNILQKIIRIVAPDEERMKIQAGVRIVGLFPW
jgi:hypothetical protein